ncbi:Pkinase-domain-containing protein [Cystobasidium minutum MCA 4210]|uniref:Pkinase-domain-containing protein n=1 Tax=Cystobasidium minutum MCA 4210 TaxID=1397322 RepID=UPI0034CD9929|eukprot:jgi/Rhomi1/188068/estExt_fgenesh1_pg.C_2_t10357
MASAAVAHHTQAGGPAGAAAAPPKSPPKLKNDKGKLTELHGEPPMIIKRNENGYLTRGRMLGEGGFARVYAATDSITGLQKAVKVISKEQLKSTKTKSKLFAEIKLHQVMDHPNIIKFECCFEDTSCVYMQLELCANGSMLDLLRRRKRFTEPETRYYLTQLIGAAQYMHQNSVIHRDLKLGNLMLDADMNLKVGDFGLAALVKFPGERKKTICGTPNYIAPEILFDQSTGHSFEADIWSIGVIIYTMLVGKPPFQTKDVKAIYKKIKHLEYSFPANVDISEDAMELIENILNREPQSRPSVYEILEHPFCHIVPFPRSIPPSAADIAPDFSMISASQSQRNQAYVQKLSGVSMAPSDASTPSVTESETFATAEYSHPEPLDKVVAMSNGTNVVAQEMALEKEVRKVLEPGSPISELLRSARKPLMVSPRAIAAAKEKEKNELARRAISSSASASRIGIDRRDSDKENVAPGNASHNASPARRVTRAQDKRAKESQKTTESDGLENAMRALRVTNNAGNVTSPKRVQSSASTFSMQDSKRKLPSSTSSPVVARDGDAESKIALPSRDIFETCWKTLEQTIVPGKATLQLHEPSSVATPKVFITAWIDYTHKYGTAYQLTDGSAGVHFNDATTMVMAPARQTFDYISNRRANVYSRRSYGIQVFPEELDRKVYLMTYFQEYMTKTLERDVDWVFSDQERTKGMDFLVKYYRMKNAIVFKLSNDVVQFNFFDHTKILLTEGATVVTFIGPDYKLKCYPLAKLLRRAEKLNILGEGPVLSSSDPAKQRTIDGLVFLFSKLEYCRETLQGLCEKRRPTTASSTAGSA